MPNSTRETVLCHYHYDPLDRQNGCTVLQQPAIQRFHCKSRLATEIQGAARWSILQHDDHLLAQQNHLDAKVSTTLLATDLQRSVLSALDVNQPNSFAYTPYGHRPAENGLFSLLGFNGERPDPVTGHYHLGNGYRQFNPVLMRFNSPDNWSPFGAGGLNAYAYCEGDPRNRVDPTGHGFFTVLKSFFTRKPKTPKVTTSSPVPSYRPRLTDTGFDQLSTAVSGPPTSGANLQEALARLAEQDLASGRTVRPGTAYGLNHPLDTGRLLSATSPASPPLLRTTSTTIPSTPTSPQRPSYRHSTELSDSPPSYNEAIRNMSPSDPNYTLSTLNEDSRRLRNAQ